MLKISSPRKARSTTTKSKITVKGTANFPTTGVYLVRVKAEHSAYQVARGEENWRITVPLLPGKNKILIRAVDTSGTSTLSRKIVVIRK